MSKEREKKMEMEQKPKTVDEWFDWKLEKYKNYTVETENANAIETLGWDRTDVLYTFLLPYRLGLEVLFEEDFNKFYKSKNKPMLRKNSKQFLYECSKQGTFNKLNQCKLLQDFVNLYFNIGNVIPIWPGGNEAKGKAGMYDMPELFFEKYDYWTQALENKYTNMYIDLFRKIEPRKYTMIRRNGDPYTFNTVEKLRDDMKNDKNLYYDYLAHRNEVIRDRTQKIKEELKNKETAKS